MTRQRTRALIEAIKAKATGEAGKVGDFYASFADEAEGSGQRRRPAQA